MLLKDAEDPKSSHDFGKDILPRMVDDYRVYAYNFVDENKKEALYWRDVGTLEAYYEANMDIVSVSPVFNLYDDALADPHPSAPISAGEIRLRRTRAHRHGARFHRRPGLHRFRRHGAEMRALARRARELLHAKWTTASSSLTSTSAAIAASAAPSSTATCTSPKAPPSDIDTEADRQRYFVTESGITVVTRDYSLFENPVTVDYFTSE